MDAAETAAGCKHVYSLRPSYSKQQSAEKLQCTLFLHIFDLKPDNNGEKNAALHNVSNNIQKVESKSFYII